eukprot:CAMPEP_0178537860 /NCGR_PEP_ID=MMETSP0696-20121128/36811_1 /TAXON_ID=265572 /ORGANISM="Extubocellulus spinifer, Strain CCMP396" /LENGTH=160 /DNA_ID=CAMNT_0020170109 /DNA_START=104 /DNA_END=584 /DNA_ORIENTATION=-
MDAGGQETVPAALPTRAFPSLLSVSLAFVIAYADGFNALEAAQDARDASRTSNIPCLILYRIIYLWSTAGIRSKRRIQSKLIKVASLVGQVNWESPIQGWLVADCYGYLWFLLCTLEQFLLLLAGTSSSRWLGLPAKELVVVPARRAAKRQLRYAQRRRW